jgi:hypothetical protein
MPAVVVLPVGTLVKSSLLAAAGPTTTSLLVADVYTGLLVAVTFIVSALV